MEDAVLLVGGALDDALGPGAHLVLDLLDDGHDEGGDLGRDEGVELVLEALDDLGQDGDARQGVRDDLHDAVVPLDDGHDLPEDVGHPERDLLGVPVRLHLEAVHLRRRRVLLDLVELVRLALAAEDGAGDHGQQLAQQRRVLVPAVLQVLLQLLHLVGRQLVRDLARDRVQEVDLAEGAGDDGVDLAPDVLEDDADVAPDVGEDVAVAQLDEGELDVVGVREEVLEAVQARAHEAQRLVEGVVAAGGGVLAAELDAAAEQPAQQARRGRDVLALVGDVVDHARRRVEGQLALLVDGAPQAVPVVLGVVVAAVALGVVDVLFRTVAAEALLGDLEFLGAEAEVHAGGSGVSARVRRAGERIESARVARAEAVNGNQEKLTIPEWRRPGESPRTKPS